MSTARNQRRHDDRIVKKAGRHYAEHGCDRCGGKGSTSVAVVMPDGTPLCRDCLTPSEARRGIGSIHGIAKVSDGHEADRIWFAANPGQEWRLRPTLHMERAELLGRKAYLELVTTGALAEMPVAVFDERTATHVFTYQIAPGQRIRRLCTPPCPDDQIPTWAEEVVLPAVKAMADASLRANLAFSPEFHALATNAHSILHMPHGHRFAADAMAQGQAMVEGKGVPRQ
jgi:hypothetical protein